MGREWGRKSRESRTRSLGLCVRHRKDACHQEKADKMTRMVGGVLKTRAVDDRSAREHFLWKHERVCVMGASLPPQPGCLSMVLCRWTMMVGSRADGDRRGWKVLQESRGWDPTSGQSCLWALLPDKKNYKTPQNMWTKGSGALDITQQKM